MAPRDVDALRARLTAIAAAARALSSQIEDLHVYAFDRPAGGEVKVSGGNSIDDPMTVGDSRARVLWSSLEAKLKAVETTVVGLSQSAGNCLSAGPGPEEMRGTHIRPAELKKAIKRQARRNADGEYTPHRLMPQPPYPGA